MATTELTQSKPAGAGEKVRMFIEAGLARLVALWRARQNRRSVARLLEWDAHMLRDVGLTPGDVRAALASPFPEDPSYRLGTMSLERRRAVHAGAKERLEQQGYFLRTNTKRSAPPSSSGAREDRLSA